MPRLLEWRRRLPAERTSRGLLQREVGPPSSSLAFTQRVTEKVGRLTETHPDCSRLLYLFYSNETLGFTPETFLYCEDQCKP
jgi:hypothetical protein